MFDADTTSLEEINEAIADSLRTDTEPEPEEENEIFINTNGSTTITLPSDANIGTEYNIINGGGTWSHAGFDASDINNLSDAVTNVEPLQRLLNQPTEPNVGDIYFDSETQGLMMYNGTEWNRMMPYERDIEGI